MSSPAASYRAQRSTQHEPRTAHHIAPHRGTPYLCFPPSSSTILNPSTTSITFRQDFCNSPPSLCRCVVVFESRRVCWNFFSPSTFFHLQRARKVQSGLLGTAHHGRSCSYDWAAPGGGEVWSLHDQFSCDSLSGIWGHTGLGTDRPVQVSCRFCHLPNLWKRLMVGPRCPSVLVLGFINAEVRTCVCFFRTSITGFPSSHGWIDLCL